jgi:hypothetical protein
MKKCKIKTLYRGVYDVEPCLSSSRKKINFGPGKIIKTGVSKVSLQCAVKNSDTDEMDTHHFFVKSNFVRSNTTMYENPKKFSIEKCAGYVILRHKPHTVIKSTNLHEKY